MLRVAKLISALRDTMVVCGKGSTTLTDAMEESVDGIGGAGKAARLRWA